MRQGRTFQGSSGRKKFSSGRKKFNTFEEQKGQGTAERVVQEIDQEGHRRIFAFYF